MEKILTYQEVLEITKANESFKMKHQTIGDTEIAMCTYFLATPGDFFDAFNDGSMINATELRGITFTNYKNEGWKTHLFMSKFFNLNQTNGSDITNMRLVINGNEEICNINKLFSTDGIKTCRALDLKSGMETAVFDRNTNTIGDSFVIDTIEKDILPTAKPENSWMYNDIKHLNIKRIANKDDGSAIRFLLINNELVAKTKFSLEAEQCQMAMDIVNNNNQLKSFILKTLEQGLCALFEIVSPFNKIVLSYNKSNLVLLQLRDEMNGGKYLDIYKHKLVLDFNIECAHGIDLSYLEIGKKYSRKNAIIALGINKFKSLEDMSNYLVDYTQTNNIVDSSEKMMTTTEFIIFAKEYIEDKEGWVITFDNDKIAKVKTDWYMALHGVLTAGLKEHLIIDKVIDESIDDIISMIPPENTEERDFIDGITHIIVKHINHTLQESEKLFKTNWNGNKKDIAVKLKGSSYFPYVMNFANGCTFDEVESIISERVRFNCRRLEMAKKYLKDLGFSIELKEIEIDE